MTETPPRTTSSLGRAAQAVCVAAGAGFLTQHTIERMWQGALHARSTTAVVAGLGVIVILTALGSTRRRLLFLSSKHLAVVTLVALSIFGILGTLVIQGAPPIAYETTYGSAAGLVRYLLLTDVFHSLPFAFVMSTAAAGLLLSFFRSGQLTARRLGILAAHGGCLLMLAGGSVQALKGQKGRLQLREGETVDTFARSLPDGTSELVGLGFALRLDDFEVLSYEPEIRLRFFEVVDDRQEMIESVDPATALDDPESLSHLGVKVTDYWPDHEFVHDVSATTPAQEGYPALGLSLASGGQDPTRWLFDTGRLEDGRVMLTESSRITFVWTEQDAQVLVGSQGQAPDTPHVIQTKEGPLRVKVGQIVDLPRGGRFKVASFFHDLLLDQQTHEATNRSDEPRNPALEVQLLDEQGSIISKTWLFANFPAFHSTDESSPLATLDYDYEPGSSLSQEWVAVGETRKLEKVGSRKPPLDLQPGARIQVDGIDLIVEDVLERAKVTTSNTTLSDTPLRPVVRLARDGSKPLILPEGHAVDLGSGLHVVLARKEDSTKAFISTVTVLESGHEVRTANIEVNHPLEHGGYSLYQSDFDPEDLSLTGLSVVRDPGLWVVYAGFLLCTLGILAVFYMHPALVRRSRREGG